MMKDKNVDAYLSLIAPKCKAIYATQVDNARSMSASELALVAKKYCDNVFTVDNAEKAITCEGFIYTFTVDCKFKFIN